MALTSDIMVSQSSAKDNELLGLAAKSAKNMPKLQISEIWCYWVKEAGILQYNI